MRVLALDQGTSATKAVVFDEDGAILSFGRGRGDAARRRRGGVEQDPEQLWESVRRAGREAVDRAGGGVDAVGFANQGETVLAWDRRTGRPLSPALSWQDRRAASVCADMADQAGAPDPDHRPAARSVFRGAEDGVAAATTERATAS